MLRTKNNERVEAAIVAVGKAHMRMPGVNAARVIELATKVDALLAGHMTAECTVAVCVELLRLIGAKDFADLGRFRVQ